MPPIENKILANRLKSIAAELVSLSKNIDHDGLALPADAFMFEEPGTGPGQSDGHQDLALAAYAENLYQERRRRVRHFPQHLFAEPAWDILLDLFVNGVRIRSPAPASRAAFRQPRVCAGSVCWKRKAC
jgi:hypothetical protein